MEKIADKLKELDIFKHVYFITEYQMNPSSYSTLLTAMRLLFPHRTIKRHLLFEKDIENSAYEKMIIGVTSFFAMNLHDYCKVKEVYFIEDGTLSYVQQDLKNVYLSKRFRCFSHFCHRGVDSFKVTKLFINNADIYKGGFHGEIVQLPRLDKDRKMLHIIEDVFDYKKNVLYRESRMVFLAPSELEITEEKCVEKGIMDILKRCHDSNELIIRLHPAQKGACYTNWKLDKIDNLWELECINQITDKHILIGVFSTAQFSPKFIMNEEPFVIFLHELFYQDTLNVKYLIDSLLKEYKNPNKIFVPRSVDEFDEILNELESYE